MNKFNMKLNIVMESMMDCEAAGCVVKHNNKFLVIVTKKGLEFPKGHVDYLEIPSETAVRETQEETNIVCSIQGAEPVKILRSPASKKVVFYKAKYVSGEPAITEKADKNIVDVRWVTNNELKQKLVKWQKPILDNLNY